MFDDDEEDLKDEARNLYEQDKTASEIGKELKVPSEKVKTLVTQSFADQFNKEIKTGKKEEDIVLTPEQEQRIVDAWNNKIDALKDLIHTAFGGDFDGRSKEGKAVKKFLATRQIRGRPANEYKKMDFELSDDHKDFIKNNSSTMSPLEIAQTIFNDITLGPLSIQARTVRDFLEGLGSGHNDIFIPPDKGIEVAKEYRAPRSIEQAVARINRYVVKSLNPEKLNAREKQNIDSLVNYMNVYRYNMVMNEFIRQRDRDLMESSFIRFIYDKGDVSEEEVDLYINWCLDIVNFENMRRELDQLNRAREASGEKGHISKALVDYINKLREEIDSNQKRQKAAQNDLSGKRKDRVEGLGKNNVSIVQLVEAFKDHEKRSRIIKLAEARKKEVGDEIDRLSTMDGLKFELFGASKEELLNGL